MCDDPPDRGWRKLFSFKEGFFIALFLILLSWLCLVFASISRTDFLSEYNDSARTFFDILVDVFVPFWPLGLAVATVFGSLLLRYWPHWVAHGLLILGGVAGYYSLLLVLRYYPFFTTPFEEPSYWFTQNRSIRVTNALTLTVISLWILAAADLISREARKRRAIRHVTSRFDDEDDHKRARRQAILSATIDHTSPAPWQGAVRTLLWVWLSGLLTFGVVHFNGWGEPRGALPVSLTIKAVATENETPAILVEMLPEDRINVVMPDGAPAIEDLESALSLITVANKKAELRKPIFLKATSQTSYQSFIDLLAGLCQAGDVEFSPVEPSTR